jgi:hypothetical protein
LGLPAPNVVVAVSASEPVPAIAAIDHVVAGISEDPIATAASEENIYVLGSDLGPNHIAVLPSIDLPARGHSQGTICQLVDARESRPAGMAPGCWREPTFCT